MTAKTRSFRETNSRLKLVFILMAVVVLVGTSVSFISGLTAVGLRENVQHHDAVLEQLQDTLLTVQECESGQRGYLLTREDSYLEPYRSAYFSLAKRLTGLELLAEKNELPLAEVKELKGLVNQKMAEMEETIRLIRENQLPAANALIRSGSGRNLMEDIRESISGLKSEQQVERTQAERDAANSMIFRAFTFVVVAALVLAFMLWVYLRIRREMTRQFIASLETQRQKDILSVTLASIGDAVILTDTLGQITFINEVAAKLTGWESATAIGKSCTEVFQIVDESTRAVAESPVARVLRDGMTVGLANHTLLIRQDGSEVPIDDSGAPIREADGTVRGVVLVFRDFTAHKDAENLLIKARDELQLASQAKDRFLATLSHELRTPLTPVLATLGLWENTGTIPQGFRSELELVRRNVELETQLIDELLDLTRIEHGKLHLSREPVDSHPVIETVISLFRNQCQGKGVRIVTELKAERPCVDADPSRLHQILWNILGNAVKFTPTGGEIRIATDNPDREHLRIRIADTGIGMSDETISHLFQRFEQGSLPSEWKTGGLGLGLSIAKALTEAHGGQLDGHSDGVNQGSRFIMTMPAIDSPTPAPSAGKTAEKQTRKLRILFLEDHEDTALVMQTVLRGMGHTVDHRGTVAEAILQVRAASYDVLLSDLGLPDGSGMDFIRSAREVTSVPGIALTGYGMAEDIERCHQAGFNEHLTKPVDFDRLRETLEKVSAL